MSNIEVISYGGAIVVLAVAAFVDVRTGHIPNALTLPPIAIAPLIYCGIEGPRAAMISLLAALLCSAVPYLMFRLGAAGGGDVKLLAAVGAIAGISFGIETQIFGFAIASLVSLILLSFRGGLLGVLRNVMSLAVNPWLPKRYRYECRTESMSTIRMGLPFLLGALFSVWLSTGGRV